MALVLPPQEPLLARRTSEHALELLVGSGFAVIRFLGVCVDPARARRAGQAQAIGLASSMTDALTTP